MPMRICASLIAAAALCSSDGHSQHRHPDRRRSVGRKRPRDLPRAGRPVGRAPGRGCRDARGVSPRPGAGSPFYDARRARLGRSSPMPRIAALARLDAEWPGELLLVTQNVDDLHERAGLEAPDPHARRADQRLVPGVRRAVRLGRPDGRGRVVPGLRSGGSGSPRHRLVRRDALRDGADRRGAAAAATCSCRSAPRARSIPPPASSRPRAIAARGRSRSTSSRAIGSMFFDESRIGQGGRPGAERGSRKCSA